MGRLEIKEEIYDAILEALPPVTGLEGLGFNELLRKLKEKGITNSPTTLSKYLKRMEEQGLVTKKIVRSKPPRLVELFKNPKKVEELKERERVNNDFAEFTRSLLLPQLSQIAWALESSRRALEAVQNILPMQKAMEPTLRIMSDIMRMERLRLPLRFILNNSQGFEEAIKSGMLAPETPFGYAIRQYQIFKQFSRAVSEAPKLKEITIKENEKQFKYKIEAVSINEALSIARETGDDVFKACILLIKKGIVNPALTIKEIEDSPASLIDKIEPEIYQLSGATIIPLDLNPAMTLKEAFEKGILNPDMTLIATAQRLQGLKTANAEEGQNNESF